jgi:hypothetical protein
MRLTPQEAGRLGGLKGGKSRSAAKIAAARRNGFQPTKPEGVRTAPEPVKHPRIIHIVPAPSTRKVPAPPAFEFDELNQLEEGGE